VPIDSWASAHRIRHHRRRRRPDHARRGAPLKGSREKRNAIVCVTLAEKITRVATLKIEMPHSLTGWRK
jgi:hypothetical protein